MKKIGKITDLVNPESFLQVNLVKGYKYVDRAGEIVNSFSDLTTPDFQMNAGGLILNKPLSNVEEIKISSTMIWFKFVDPDSLDLSYQTYKKEAQKILEILDVAEIQRIGWRNYFVIDLSSSAEVREFLGNAVDVKVRDCSLSQVKLSVKISDEVSGTLFLNEATNSDQGTPALMFDLDLFHKDRMPIEDIGKILGKFREYLGSTNGFIALVNQCLGYE
jgi:hypothetical protein